jgi:hypothetical protein
MSPSSLETLPPPEEVEGQENSLVTPEDWRRLEGVLKKEKGATRLAILASAKLASPGQFEDYEANHDIYQEGDFSYTRSLIQEGKSDKKYATVVREGAKLKTIFVEPDRMQEFGIDEEVLNGVSAEIAQARQEERPHWPSLLRSMRDATIIFGRSEKFMADGEAFLAAQARLAEMENKEQWNEYADTLATIKILFPDQSEGMEPSHRARIGMDQKLASLRDGAEFYKREDLFLEMAANQRIALAKKVNIPERE